jgi:hypothetical protein
MSKQYKLISVEDFEKISNRAQGCNCQTKPLDQFRIELGKMKTIDLLDDELIAIEQSLRNTFLSGNIDIFFSGGLNNLLLFIDDMDSDQNGNITPK